MAAAIMADAYDIADPPLQFLQFETPINKSAWDDEFETAWGRLPR